MKSTSLKVLGRCFSSSRPTPHASSSKNPSTETALSSGRVKTTKRVKKSVIASTEPSNDEKVASSSTVARRTYIKRVKDLPTSFILANGGIAVPLGDWSDAPESIDTPRDKQLPLSNGHSDDILEHPKKRRTKAAKEPVPVTELHLLKEKNLNDGVAKQDPSLPQTQLALDIYKNRARFPHCILLTRVGQFYESYFDQAIEVSRLLGIKLTSRAWGKGRVPMCGFPLSHLDRHLKTLVPQEKRFVAMCEEFKQVDGIIDRRVVRVVTPGTLIDESFVNHYENNYLAAITLPDDLGSDVGLAWIDVSTGEFFSQSTTLESLRDELARISPREVLLDRLVKDKPEHPVHIALGEENATLTYVTSSTLTEPPAPVPLANDQDALHINPPVSVYSIGEVMAIHILTSFLKDNLLELMPSLPSPTQQSLHSRMQIDAHTIKGLEIKEVMRDGGVTGSLLSTVKRTVTSSGTRLLAQRLCSPSTSVSEINARLSVVAHLYARPHLRADLNELFKQLEDVIRIVQKFTLCRGDMDDLAAVRDSIVVSNTIKEHVLLEQNSSPPAEISSMEWKSLNMLMDKMSDLGPLAEMISLALNDVNSRKKVKVASATDAEVVDGDEPPIFSDEPVEKGLKPFIWTIKPQFSPALKMLHDRRLQLLQDRASLEARLQSTFAAPSLTLRSTGTHGLHVHVGKAKRDLGLINKSPKAVVIGQSNTTRSYFFQDWSILGSQIVEVEMAILSTERKAFDLLRNEVLAKAGSLRQNARIMDEIDVSLGFAHLAIEMAFVCPTLDESESYHVINGRHPTVELGLLSAGRVFTPNSVSINPAERVHLITGPNMSGKSSFLRQTALIAILAQAGSFVPADHAKIGVFDKVFSRVGAKDDLFRDRSTFMVEMLETADILRRATPKSLVIMDEVGRGTTVKDGMAIAFATVHHLYTVNGCRTLFATHFHEITDMLGYTEGNIGGGNSFPDLRFFRTGVNETPERYFAYSHRLEPGVNRDSHGLKVAQLAGMPPSVVRLASDARLWIEKCGESWVADRDDLRALGERLSKKPTQ